MCVWGPLLGAVCLPHSPGKQRVLVGGCSSREARHGAGGCGVPQACARRLTTYAGLCLVSIWQHGCGPCSTCFPCSLHTAVQYAAVSVCLAVGTPTCTTRAPAAACWLAIASAALPGHISSVPPCCLTPWPRWHTSKSFVGGLRLSWKRSPGQQATDSSSWSLWLVVSQQPCAPGAGLWSICACASCPAKGQVACVAVPASSQNWCVVLFEVGRAFVSLSLHVVDQVCVCVYNHVLPFSVWFWQLWLGPVGRSPASEPPQLHPAHRTESFILVTTHTLPLFVPPPFFAPRTPPACDCCTRDMLQ
jgi:hypothetical protein